MQKPLEYRKLTAPQLDAIDGLIEHYLSRQVETLEGIELLKDAPFLKVEVAEKPEAKLLEEAIKIAVASREVDHKLVAPSPNGRRIGTRCKSHQKRIPAEAYPVFEKRLVANSRRINKTADFENLHRCVAEQALGQNGIHGVGDLMVYDVALRIGLWMGEAFHPQQIYLHAYPLKSAKLIFHRKVRGRLRKSEFPAPFQKLSCIEIENFLCLYHKEICHLLAG